MDMATTIVVATAGASFGAIAMGMWTIGRKPGEGSPNVGQSFADAWQIERLTDEAAGWKSSFNLASEHLRVVLKALAEVRAENRDLHIDIEAKRKRLADAGLQSAGGCDE